MFISISIPSTILFPAKAVHSSGVCTGLASRTAFILDVNSWSSIHGRQLMVVNSWSSTHGRQLVVVNS